MQRAGIAAAGEISRRYPEQLKAGAVVFTGPGNNGGDGWVVAGTLARLGVEVTVVEVGKPTPAKSPDAVAERETAIDSVKVVDSFDGDSRFTLPASLMPLSSSTLCLAPDSRESRAEKSARR
jgi:NAD(P)H-hydrate repair Nnr-like enzyme with NAD(P)H-hydrate epimerase domain